MRISKKNILDTRLDTQEEMNLDSLGILERLNEKTQKMLDDFSDATTKNIFFYTVLRMLFILYLFFINPALEDVVKDKVFNIISYNNVAEEKSSKKIVKELKLEIFKELENINSLESLNSIRITNVYKSHSQKSGRIDQIDKNRPVIILWKNNNWSLVTYKNKNQINI